MGDDEASFPGLDETRPVAPDPHGSGSPSGATAAVKDAKHHDGHRDRLRERFAEAGLRPSPIMNCSNWSSSAPSRAATSSRSPRR
jgi:hypothetical protein